MVGLLLARRDQYLDYLRLNVKCVLQHVMPAENHVSTCNRHIASGERHVQVTELNVDTTDMNGKAK